MIFNEYRIDELCNNIKYGTMPKKEKISDIGKYNIWSGYRIVGKYDEYNIDKDQVVVVARGVGGTGDVKYSTEKCYLTNLSIALDINKSIVLPKYLYYYYQIKNLRYLDSGSAQSQITINDLKNVVVLIPSMNMQYKIVKILESFDNKIQINNKINNNLYELSNNLFKKIFEENDIKEFKRLDEISDCQNGHAFYKEGYDDAGLMVVDLGNVNLNSNFIYTNADKYINKDRIPNEKFIVKKNDLIMIMTDRKATMDLLGKTAKIYENKEYALNQRIYRIRSKINVNYLYTYLNSDKVSNELKSKALGSVQKYINTNVINEIMVPLFEDEIMEKFSNTVNPIFEYMENNILENKTLEQLRDTLLPKLMNGEIDLDNIEI